MHLKYIPRTVVALSAGALVVGLTACSGNDDSSAVVTVTSDVTTSATKTSSVEDTPTGTTGSDPVTEAATEVTGTVPDNGLPAAFADALDGITGAYQYSLVDITGDGAPELLLRQVSDGVGTITVFTSDGTRVPTTLQDGAGPDGETYSLAATTDGTGLLTTDAPAGLGTTTTVRWELVGGQLQRTADHWTYIGDLLPTELTSRQAPVSWTDGTAGGDASADSSGAGSGQQTDEPADSADGSGTGN